MHTPQKGIASILIILLSVLVIGGVAFLVFVYPSILNPSSQTNTKVQFDKNAATENRDLKASEPTPSPFPSSDPINTEENVPIYY